MQKQTFPPSAIPFHVRLTRRSRFDDHLLHFLEFGVVGVRHPARLIVGSEMYSDPVVERRVGHGGIALPSDVIDALAIMCFRFLAGRILDMDGECGTWTTGNISPWITRNFHPVTAHRMLDGLGSHVKEGLTAPERIVVGDDDVVLAD